MLRTRWSSMLSLGFLMLALGLVYAVFCLTGARQSSDDGAQTAEPFPAQFHVEVLAAGPMISQQVFFGEQHFLQPGQPVDLRLTLENSGEHPMQVRDPFSPETFARIPGWNLYGWTNTWVQPAEETDPQIPLRARLEHSVFGNSNHPLLTEFGRRPSDPLTAEEIGPGEKRQWLLPLSRIYDLSLEGLTVRSDNWIQPTFTEADFDTIPPGCGQAWSLITVSDPRLAADRAADRAAKKAAEVAADRQLGFEQRMQKHTRRAQQSSAAQKRPEPLDSRQTEIDDAGVAWGRAVADWRLGIGLDGELSNHLNGPVRLRILLKNTSQTAQTISVGPPLMLERFRFHAFSNYNYETIAPLTQHGNLELVQQQFDDIELETVAAGAVLERRFFLSRHFDLSLYPNFDVQMVRLLPQPDGSMARLISGVLPVKRSAYRGPKGPQP